MRLFAIQKGLDYLLRESKHTLKLWQIKISKSPLI